MKGSLRRAFTLVELLVDPVRLAGDEYLELRAGQAHDQAGRHPNELGHGVDDGLPAGDQVVRHLDGVVRHGVGGCAHGAMAPVEVCWTRRSLAGRTCPLLVLKASLACGPLRKS